MPLSMYDASVPVFTRGLAVLSNLLDKGARHAAEQGIAEADLVGARLAPDMLTLAGQVQRASDSAKFGVARLTGTEAPAFADEEATIAALRERCAKTVAYLGQLHRDGFADSEARSVTFGSKDAPWTLVGDAYLLSFALPNFFFHVTTAYDILRHKGVPVGKRDYLDPTH